MEALKCRKSALSSDSWPGQGNAKVVSTAVCFQRWFQRRLTTWTTQMFNHSANRAKKSTDAPQRARRNGRMVKRFDPGQLAGCVSGGVCNYFVGKLCLECHQSDLAAALPPERFPKPFRPFSASGSSNGPLPIGSFCVVPFEELFSLEDLPRENQVPILFPWKKNHWATTKPGMKVSTGECLPIGVTA